RSVLRPPAGHPADGRSSSGPARGSAAFLAGAGERRRSRETTPGPRPRGAWSRPCRTRGRTAVGPGLLSLRGHLGQRPPASPAVLRAADRGPRASLYSRPPAWSSRPQSCEGEEVNDIIVTFLRLRRLHAWHGLPPARDAALSLQRQAT